MAHEIPAGQSMLLIKRDAYERANLTRAAIDDRLGLTPDEFRVEGDIVAIGPLHGAAGDALGEFVEDLEKLGLVYFDDFFELSGSWPQWLRLFASGGRS